METPPGALSPQEPGKLFTNEPLMFPSLEMTTEQNQRAKYPAYPRTGNIYNKSIPELVPWLQASGLLWINCSTVPGWTTAFTLDVMDMIHAQNNPDGTKFLLLSHFCTEQEKQSHWTMAGVSREVMIMQSFLKQAISQSKVTLGPKISQEVRELAARKSRDTGASVEKLRELLGNLFNLIVKGGCQIYVFMNNIDAIYPPYSSTAAANPGNNDNFDGFVRMLKETAQYGREIATTKYQRQINVLVTSGHLCDEKYLDSNEVSLSSKSLRLGKTPRMNISKVLFPAIVPVREARMALFYIENNAASDKVGEAKGMLGRERDSAMFPIKINTRRKDRDDGEDIFGVAPAEPHAFIDRYGYE